MKNSVFIKVRVENELPTFTHGQYKGMFITDRGYVYYCKYDGWYEDIEWWLKEVELPSDDELNEQFGKISDLSKADEVVNIAITKSLHAGANYILSKLK